MQSGFIPNINKGRYVANIGFLMRTRRRIALSSGSLARPRDFSDRTDIVEDKDALTFYIDPPNLDEGSLDVSLESNRLNVKATRRAPSGECKTVYDQGCSSGTNTSS